MSSVAKRLFLGFLTAAKRHLTGFIGFVSDRRKPRAFMAAVAKRLRGASSAGAPGISLAFFQFGFIGGFLRLDGLVRFFVDIAFTFQPDVVNFSLEIDVDQIPAGAITETDQFCRVSDNPVVGARLNEGFGKNIGNGLISRTTGKRANQQDNCGGPSITSSVSSTNPRKFFTAKPC